MMCNVVLLLCWVLMDVRVCLEWMSAMKCMQCCFAVVFGTHGCEGLSLVDVCHDVLCYFAVMLGAHGCDACGTCPLAL